MEAKANSDIGLNEGDASYLRSQYPKIADVLIWPELYEVFQEHELKAAKLKSSSRLNSFGAVFAIVGSLGVTLISSSELSRIALADNPILNKILASVSCILLIVALMLGKGILFGRKRDRWLAHRITAERIRQLYFQFLLANLGMICRGGVLDHKAVLEARPETLQRVLRRVRASNYRQLVREDGALQEARLIDLQDSSVPTDSSPHVQEITAFWKEARFEWQSGYAIGQLDRKASAFPLFGSLADQKATLSVLEFAMTLGLVALQCVIVISQFFVEASLPSMQAAVLLTSLFAIVIVGLQAYEDGLNLNEDVSRNRTYASYTSKLLRDFNDALDQGDGQAQFRSMREMEDLAYFEMQQFLHTQSTARFSL